MKPEDLGKLVLQNIKVYDPHDALFEMKQLEVITAKHFNKEEKLLQIPNVSGRPNILKKVYKMFQKDYPEYKKSKLVSPSLEDRFDNILNVK